MNMDHFVVAAFFTLHLRVTVVQLHQRETAPRACLPQDTPYPHLQRIRFALEAQILTSTNAHSDAAAAIYTCTSEAFSPEETPPEAAC